MLTHGLHVEYVFCGTLLRLKTLHCYNNNKVSQQSYNDEINKHDDNMFMSVDRICSLLHGTCTTVCIMLLDEREYNNRE